MNQERGPAGTPVTKVAGTAHPVPRVRRLTWLPVLAYIVLIAILYTALSRSLAASLVFDPPVLMLVLNTVFLFGISLAVCTVAMRAYLASGSSNILLLGCGVLTLGCAALAGGWVRPLGETANASVTIHNLGVLLASIVYAMSALLTLLKAEPEQIMEKRQQRVFFALAGTLILISIIIAGTLRGAVPLFWAADVGSTPVKQLVLSTAIVLFALTSIYTMILYFQTSHYFLYWYSLALALTAIGLIGITVMKAVGDPIGWAGRTAQYLGGVYFLIAALSALRNAQRQGLTLEAAINRFYSRSEVHYRDLVDTVSDAIISIDERKRVLLWNQGAEKMLGYSPDEAAGRLVADLVMPEGFGEKLNEELQALQGEDSNPFAAKGLEIEMRRKDGATFPSETALSMRRIGSSWIAALVVRDITERKRAEETLKKAHDELEMRVQQRTEELQAINEQLKIENQERVKVEIELRESEQRLRELSMALLSAQERERKLIAQEIHDGLGAYLAATRFKVESVLTEMGDDNPQAKIELESVIPIVQETIEEARRIQMSLRPSILDDLGILPTIKWSCQQFESTYPAIRITKEIDIEEDDVPKSLKIVIYRILQEALNNIAKHSKTSVVSLFLRKTDQAIHLVISDRGQGFNLEEVCSRKGVTKGLGLDSMKERAELLEGSFDIKSVEGKGTTICASWPLMPR